MKTLQIALLGLALAFGLAACRKATPEIHTTTGVIREIQNQGRILVISHQAFPSWMEAMTMPFELKDPKLGAGLKAGDSVEFTVSAQEDGYPITAIKKVIP
jgi:Cu/Ag efflux protein CusF